MRPIFKHQTGHVERVEVRMRQLAFSRTVFCILLAVGLFLRQQFLPPRSLHIFTVALSLLVPALMLEQLRKEMEQGGLRRAVTVLIWGFCAAGIAAYYLL
jgi:hypothetical protein